MRSAGAAAYCLRGAQYAEEGGQGAADRRRGRRARGSRRRSGREAGRDHHPDDPDRAAGLHGGVPNAPGYQLWLSAIGLQPQDNKFYNAVYPWLGFRIGVIGNP